MIADHTLYTFFLIVISSNFFIRYYFEQKIHDKVHHLNKLENKKDLIV